MSDSPSAGYDGSHPYGGAEGPCGCPCNACQAVCRAVPRPARREAALDPELMPYLDWPLGFFYGVGCDKQDHQGGGCDEAGSAMILDAEFGTVRELLMAVKAHADVKSHSEEAATA